MAACAAFDAMRAEVQLRTSVKVYREMPGLRATLFDAAATMPELAKELVDRVFARGEDDDEAAAAASAAEAPKWNLCSGFKCSAKPAHLRARVKRKAGAIKRSKYKCVTCRTHERDALASEEWQRAIEKARERGSERVRQSNDRRTMRGILRMAA